MHRTVKNITTPPRRPTCNLQCFVLHSIWVTSAAAGYLDPAHFIYFCPNYFLLGPNLKQT